MAFIPPNPNGSATSANSAPVVVASDQTTIKTKLANDIAQTTGNITTASSTVTTGSLTGVGSATIQISGTYAGVNITFEVSVDNTNWVGMPVVQLASANPTATLTSGSLTNNTVIYNMSPLLGINFVRVRATAWTSGTAAIIIQPSAQFVSNNINAVVTSAPTTAVTLNAGSNIAGKVGIDQTTVGTTNAVSLAQIGATTIVTGGVAGTIATGGVTAAAATATGNPVRTGAIGKTANPTAVTDGQVANIITDKLGKQVVVGSLRDLKSRQSTTLTSTTTETTIVTAGGAGVFNDVYGLIIANTSATGTQVIIRDVTAGGTPLYFWVPANDTRGFMLPEGGALKQGTAASAWTATCGTSVASIQITALYVANL